MQNARPRGSAGSHGRMVHMHELETYDLYVCTTTIYKDLRSYVCMPRGGSIFHDARTRVEYPVLARSKGRQDIVQAVTGIAQIRVMHLVKRRRRKGTIIAGADNA